MCHFILIKIEIYFVFNYVYKTFTVPCENSKTFSFVSSIIKKMVVFPALSKFAVKLICWIAFGSESKACYLLKSIAIIL